jgi:hypothetical protein
MRQRPRVKEVGIKLNDGEDCSLILTGWTALYLHGTYDAMVEFGRSIIAEADRKKHQEADADAR